ncbi:MAG: rRNA maturation RNase YbeY [Rhodobacteraceae bacterium]|nr:rRNA maturation RNase YbeY [Paracoccaceae bacterium]
MASVEAIIEDVRWDGAGLPGLAARAARAVLTHLGLGPEAFEIGLLGCDDARIAVLNADFRGKPQPTNVLSWPSEDRAPQNPGSIPAPPGPGELGDIAIAFDTCVREAADQGKPIEHHVTHLLVHGMLHLLGYDHMDGCDAARMEGLEVEILATLGVPDPY